MIPSAPHNPLRRVLFLAPILLALLFVSMGQARADDAVVKAVFRQTGGWNGGFGAEIDLVNGTAQPISGGWTFKFDFVPTVDSLWNGTMTRDGNTYTVTNLDWNATIPAGGKVTLGLSATGKLEPSSPSNVVLNGAAITSEVQVGGGPGPTTGDTSPITIVGPDDTTVALQITIPQGVTSFPVKMSNNAAGTFEAVLSNSTVASVKIAGNNTLELTGKAAGRSGLKIKDTVSGGTRYVGIRVKTAGGQLPGFPSYLALGSVSEDTDDHLNFWRDFGPGPKNKRMDVRYIYLNGGPEFGWTTWTSPPGGRAIKYIQESRRLGIMPFFVFYNIPDGGESYTTDKTHMQSVDYMKQYYTMLKFTLDIINTESPDDTVGIILEPDFLGYMAQNEPGTPATISAMVHAAYDSGVLVKGTDPDFPDTLQGLVQSINYIIHKTSPQVFFGWQVNLWASPQGGWTTPIPGNGLMHKTDDIGVAAGRPLIYNEAKAITKYYLDAGIGSNGANFVSIDKYGLDAASSVLGPNNGTNPAASLWFWNNDQWGNYLAFVQSMHDQSTLPVVLWQLPVGHVNHSTATNPYDASGAFPDLPNQGRKSEDSAPTFFFGDTFTADGPRFEHFSKNNGNDPTFKVSGNAITWGSHMKEAAEAGVTLALFGAGVGDSTTNVGSPPTDDFWWITKSQGYYDNAIPLTPPATLTGDVNQDGKVDVSDAILALQFVVGLKTATTEQTTLADMNNDGGVNVQDATLILRKAVGLD